MTARTWKIRDQLPDGSWGPECEVTLAQYLAEVKAKAARAMEIHRQNVAMIAAQR
jgi:hypothetical protein